MKSASKSARTLKSAARSAKSTTTRKPSKRTAKSVNIRRVKASEFDPPSMSDGCPPEITAEARALFPDLPFTIKTASGKEITSSVMDMRQEIYRLRRMKGDMLVAPGITTDNAAGEASQLAVVSINGPDGSRYVKADINIAAAEKFAEGFNADAPKTHRAVVHYLDIAGAISRDPSAVLASALTTWLDRLSTKITGGDMPGRWLRKIALNVVNELLIGLDDAMGNAGESEDYRPDGAYNIDEHFDRMAAAKKGA